MLIAKVNIAGEVLEVADYRQWFRHIPSDQELINNNFMKVNVFLPHDRRTQKLASVAPYIQDGWVYTIEVQEMTEEEKQAVTDSEAANVRAMRNKLLADCDWTQLEDSPVDKLVWKTYRQELRDVSNQEGFPWTVQWPVVPGTATE
jgi:hypothetical protein